MVFTFLFLFFCFVLFCSLNGLYPLFFLASVAADQKASTEADVMRKIGRVLKHAHDKIGG